MSFAHHLKNEITANKHLRHKNPDALLLGLLRFGKACTEKNISIHTEHKPTARLYCDLISDLVPLTQSITMQEAHRGGDRRSVYMVTVDSVHDRLKILSYYGYDPAIPSFFVPEEDLEEKELPAFITGAFLACAGVSDPEKGYRVELKTPNAALADVLEELLAQALHRPKRTTRRNDYILYYKESEQIEDFFAYIGAPRSAMEVMEVKIVKELRNRVNRATNCETANISKTIDASVSQIEDIRLIESHGGIEMLLPEELREIARLRVDNPEMSLRELGEQLSNPISRSGANHRLRRIADIAAGLREKQ